MKLSIMTRMNAYRTAQNSVLVSCGKNILFVVLDVMDILTVSIILSNAFKRDFCSELKIKYLKVI